MVESNKGASCERQRVKHYMAVVFSPLVLELELQLKAEDLKNSVRLCVQGAAGPWNSPPAVLLRGTK